MEIRPFVRGDAPGLVALSADCARGEGDFVLNPLWETEEELFAEFGRFAIDPAEHVLVADAGDGELVGLAGFLRQPRASAAGMFCPIVKRGERGRGLGGELLRAALAHGAGELGIKLVSAGVGTRNRAGYSLLSSHGFRPARQHFLMRCVEQPEVTGAPLADLELRKAGSDDAEAILEIYAACGFEERSTEAMRSYLEDGRHSHAVALCNGRIAAFAEIETHWPRRPWVAYVGVNADLRDRGVGSTLVAWALEREFEGGAASALLMLSPANRTALRAYEKVGFRRHRLVDVLEKGL
ncbi:MAG: GNAT family N-acetyltransferase [Myxococcota bacterium]